MKGSAAEFSLSIFSIKLAVKFPCRMSLHQDGKPITAEVQPSANVFAFNQDITVKVDPKNDVEISAYLSTGKGGSILAGVMVASVTVLAAREGERFSLPLQKCLDSSATIEIKVGHAWVPQQRPAIGVIKSSAGGMFVRAGSPNSKAKFRTQNDYVETRSEININNPRKGPAGGVTIGAGLLKMREMDREEQKRFASRESANVNKFSFRNQFPENLEQDLRQTRTIGGNATKVRREKDKERLERLAAKKISDETENNLKMDIMKYKMKGEELQKTITEKTRQIKQLKDTILQHQRKNIEKSYIQEQLISKQNTIKILEDRINNLNNENINLRENIAENLKSIGELKQNIRFDILKNKEDYERKEHILRNQLSDCRSRITELEADSANKHGQLLKAKKYIEDLESAAEKKIFEHDQIIQDLKKEQAAAIKEISRRIAEGEGRIQELMKQISNKTSTIAKCNDTIVKLEQNLRSYQQKNQILEMEKTELLSFKADFQALTKRYAKLEETLRDEQKNSKKIFESKNKQIAENIEISNKNIKSLEVKINSANEKMKQQKNKIQQLENTISSSKNEQQKLRRSLQKSEKSTQELLSRYHSLEKQLKNSETRNQQLEKQLSEKSNNSTHIESLYKIELEHSKETTTVLTKDLQQFSSKYTAAKEQLELVKNERVKLENKMLLLEENISRLNEYIREKKVEFEAKEADLKEQIKNNNKIIKNWEENDKNKQKEINAWEIRDLTNGNKIDKLEKALEQSAAKIDKLEKVTVVKLQEEKEKLQHELEATKIKLAEVVEENKFITNERSKLQSETHKSNKINTVLNEEKIETLNELNKLKNAVQRLEKQEEKLVNQLKNSNQQNKRLTLKIQNYEKQLSKNKETLNQTVSSIMNMNNLNATSKKLAMKQSLSIGDMTARRNQVKKKESYIENLSNSRVIASISGQNYSYHSFGAGGQIDIKRISEIIESTSKEQQNTIMLQQETINHYKDSIDKLEKEIATLSFTSQAGQAKAQENIDMLNNQLEGAHEKILTITNNYEDRISKLETEINKKEKDIKLHKSSISSLKYELETLKKKTEMLMEESDLRDHKNGDKITELVGELNFVEGTVKNLQAEKRSLQTKVYSLEEDLSIEKEERNKKQRYISEISERITVLQFQNEELNKAKKQNVEQLLSLREQLHAEKQKSEKMGEQLQVEQKNNKRLQDFINDLIKQKQNIVKVQLQSSSKAIEMQGTVLQMKNLLQNKEQVIRQKDQQIVQYKGSIKSLQSEVKNLEMEIKEANTKIVSLNAKIQEKEKKVSDREHEIKQLNSQYATTNSKNKEEIKLLKQQYENLAVAKQRIEQEKNTKIFILQKETTELHSQIQSLQSELTQKQELIFFERQKCSLLESNINDMKKGHSETSLHISKYQAEINELNEELTKKEELLYDYSGKIYQLEQTLEAKDAEIAIRQEKVDNDWQCRHDEICEQYEQKIEMLEKEKKYLKDKLDLLEQEKTKHAKQRQYGVEQFERELASAKAKERALEEEKLQVTNQKNKEIENLRAQITILNNQVKNSLIEVKKKQNQIANKDEVIKKLEIKMSESDRGSGSLKKQYELQINNLKKNQNAIKTLKEEIKNAQWVAERQAKKITQTFIQRVVNCFPEGKQKLAEPIRALEASMASAINFKV